MQEFFDDLDKELGDDIPKISKKPAAKKPTGSPSRQKPKPKRPVQSGPKKQHSPKKPQHSHARAAQG